MSASRTPSEARTPRMEPLARLPVFFGLTGRRAVVAGGGPAAAWKAELLAAAGAVVEVFSPEASEELLTVAREAPRRSSSDTTGDASIAVHARHWAPEDLAGAAIAVGAFADDQAASTFVTAARSAGVPVNIVDRPAFSDFQFGSIVNRSPLVVGISTDGAAPVFAQAVRAKIETILPQGFRRWAEAARAWRPAVHGLRLGFRARRTFWERFAALALAAPGRPPTEDDRERLVAAIVDEAAAAPGIGSVALVGAGPGDPELLTLKAVRILQSADVVLFDDLVSP